MSSILAQINIQISSYYSRNHDLFVVPYFKSKSGKVSFLVRALQLANKLFIALDFYDMQRDTFKSKSIIFLK